MATITGNIAEADEDFVSLSEAEASISTNPTDRYEFTYVGALSDTTPVTFTFGTNLGAGIYVYVDEAYRCKGAPSGAHAELRYSVDGTGDTLGFTSALVQVHDLRIVRTGTANAAADAVNFEGADLITLNRCTIVGNGGLTGRLVRILVGAVSPSLLNCVFISSGCAHAAAMVFNSSATLKMYRCSMFLADGSCATGMVKSHGATASADVRQTLALKAAGATTADGAFFVSNSGIFHADCANNGAHDESAPGADPNDNLDPASVYTTLTAGSEDLHYPSYAAMTTLIEGADLSATTGTTDVDGETVAEWYPGADYIEEPAAPPAVGLLTRIKRRFNLRFRFR